MNVKVPCKLGSNIVTEKGFKKLTSIFWYRWSDGIEVTYFFANDKKWESSDFICEKEPTYKLGYEIDDDLLVDDFLSDKGYPLKGRGYICGLRMVDKKLFAELILTDKYLAHIYVECDEHGRYVKNGSVYVPPSWDTLEKQYSIILKKHSNIQVNCIR